MPTEFFQVSGERKEYVIDRTTGQEVATGKILPTRVRFETRNVKEAEQYASDVYRREGIICEIHQVQR
jgi:hypothetical protein